MTANDASDLVRSWLDTLVRLEWIRNYRVVSVVVDGEESTVSVEVLPQMHAKVVDVTITFDKADSDMQIDILEKQLRIQEKWQERLDRLQRIVAASTTEKKPDTSCTHEYRRVSLWKKGLFSWMNDDIECIKCGNYVKFSRPVSLSMD